MHTEPSYATIRICHQIDWSIGQKHHQCFAKRKDKDGHGIWKAMAKSVQAKYKDDSRHNRKNVSKLASSRYKSMTRFGFRCQGLVSDAMF